MRKLSFVAGDIRLNQHHIVSHCTAVSVRATYECLLEELVREIVVTSLYRIEAISKVSWVVESGHLRVDRLVDLHLSCGSSIVGDFFVWTSWSILCLGHVELVAKVRNASHLVLVRLCLRVSVDLPFISRSDPMTRLPGSLGKSCLRPARVDYLGLGWTQSLRRMPGLACTDSTSFTGRMNRTRWGNKMK